MQVVRIKAEPRTAIGRNQVAQLRQQGWLPAVVYGDGKEPMPIAVSEWELDQHVKAHQKVFQLEISGQAQAALLQEVSWYSMQDRPRHADFKRIDLSKPIETEVEVALVGHPVGLGKGGTLMKDHVVIEIRCLPTAIPDHIEYDVSKLDLDEVVLASQLTLPQGITLLTPGTTSICHVAKLVVQALPEAPVAAPAEGAEPAAAAPAAAPAKGAPPAKS